MEGAVHGFQRMFAGVASRLTATMADKIEASLDDGVLSVRIAKSERTEPRRVEVRGGA